MNAAFYLFSYLSAIFYRLLEYLSYWVSLPQKIERTLLFRKRWKDFQTEPKKVKLWIHGASAGELEDLAAFFLDPEMLALAGLTFSDLLITASSISAESKVKQWSQKYSFAYCGPLPPERKSDIKAFLERYAPELWVISQNDFWPYLIHRAAKRLSRGIIWAPAKNPDEKANSFFGAFLKSHGLKEIFLRADYPVKTSVSVKVVGSLRMDRVLNRIVANQNQPTHVLERFGLRIDPARVSLLVGSAHLRDALFINEVLQALSPADKAQIDWVIIPHDSKNTVETAQISRLVPSAKLVITDGILLEAYKNFSLAYVGGAFDEGVHNVLEAALWGIPVVTGPKVENAPEMERLVRQQQGYIFQKATEFAKWMGVYLKERSRFQQWAEQSSQSLWAQKGATKIFAHEIRRVLNS